MSFKALTLTRSRRGNHLRVAAALMLGTAMTAIVAEPVQAQVNNASLRGTITSGGQPATGQLTIVEVNTGYRSTTNFAADGGYNFPSLRPGTYRLEVGTGADAKRTDDFQLSVGQSAGLDFDLSETQAPTAEAPAAGEPAPEAEGEAIIVTGRRLKRMEGGEVGINVSQRMIEQLPQNNRNFLAFADLAPGVQFIENSGGDTSLRGGAQGANAINVFIDGVSQKDYVLKGGVTGQDSTQGNPFPQLAIGEYRVISSNYKAEFDQVSSAAITAVTKSGTNDFHGEAFVDFTNQDLRERRPSEMFGNNPVKLRSKDLQFGGALGGPIIKDVLHFFASYEGKRRTEPRDIFPGLDLPISFFPSEYQGYFGGATETFNEDLYFGKINFAPTSKDLFEFSLKHRKETGEDLGNGLSAFDTRTSIDVKEWRGLARWEHSEDTWVNDFKVGYEDVSWGPQPVVNGNVTVFNARVPNIPPATGTRRGDILRFGGGTNFQDKGQSGWTVSDDFTYTGFEGHTIKVGVKAKWVSLNTLQANNTNPVYFYNVTRAPGSFNDDIPYRVQFGAPVSTDDPRIRSKNFQLGLYIQDDWDVTDRLTLNLGLRWDYERTPAFLNYVHDPAIVALVTGQTNGLNGQPPRYNNLANADYDINDYISTGNERKAFKGAWQPRIGFSYELDDEARFVVFGGYGRSYDRTQFDFIQQELAQGLFAGRTFNFFVPGSPGPEADDNCTPSVTCVAWNPIYLTPEGRQQLLAGLGTVAGGRELRFINNDLKTPYSDQFSLGVRGRFGLLDTEVGYSHVVSKDGFVYLLGNRRPDGTFFPPTGNPSAPFNNDPLPFADIIIGTNGVETRADTAYLKLTKRYTASSRWNLDATYTFTQAEDNRKFDQTFALDFPSIDDYPFVRSGGVRKHRLVMAGAVDLPWDMVLSGKFQIASPVYLTRIIDTAGTPPSRTVGSIEVDGNGDRWGYRQMDLALTKYIPIGFPNDEAKIRLRVDVLNVFNDRNYNSFSAVTGLRNTSAYGTDGPPRTIKVSAGFSF